MKHLVDFLRRATETDDAGQEVGVWKVIDGLECVPAKVKFVSGTEGTRGEQVEAVATHEVTTRTIEGVTPAMRIAWEGRTLEIVSMGDRSGRGYQLVFRCSEVMA